ncbi:MAG: hypothetical protein EON59_10070 [Alphaproteobacteria bacterium]|nr:MAG: hypothetical protein EON59_10070 [Alphaproteobacteria bacterium]
MAAKRDRLSARIRADHPICAYCAGVSLTEQADHVPPISMFSLKRRPEGLEFPACKGCHEGTRRIDLVASLTARSWPNLPTEEERAELGDLMGGVLRNVPPVAHELAMGFRYATPVPGDIQAAVGAAEEVIVMDFTVRRAILEAFGARVGLAFHYMETGSVLPEAGAVWSRAYTNVENIRGEALPADLGDALGPTLALIQKGLRAEDDFQCATRRIDDYGGVISFASFRKSFAVLAVSYPRSSDFPELLQAELFRPGFLIGYPL